MPAAAATTERELSQEPSDGFTEPLPKTFESLRAASAGGGMALDVTPVPAPSSLTPPNTAERSTPPEPDELPKARRGSVWLVSAMAAVILLAAGVGVKRWASGESAVAAGEQQKTREVEAWIKQQTSEAEARAKQEVAAQPTSPAAAPALPAGDTTKAVAGNAASTGQEMAATKKSERVGPPSVDNAATDSSDSAALASQSAANSALRAKKRPVGALLPEAKPAAKDDVLASEPAVAPAPRRVKSAIPENPY
jgi:type IV secretory pathway VirB10-like protein